VTHRPVASVVRWVQAVLCARNYGACSFVVAALAVVFGLGRDVADDVDVAVLALHLVLQRYSRAVLGITAGLWMLRYEIR
jgi:hypothetical protein